MLEPGLLRRLDELLERPIGRENFHEVCKCIYQSYKTVDYAHKRLKELRKKLESTPEGDGEWVRGFVQERGGVLKAQEKARIFALEAGEILASFKSSTYRESLERLVVHDLERTG